jgi:hypothetical protein
VASVVGSLLLIRRSIVEPCAACGHGRFIHRGDGDRCDSLIGESIPCGCEAFMGASSRHGAREVPAQAGELRDRSRRDPGRLPAAEDARRTDTMREAS